MHPKRNDLQAYADGVLSEPAAGELADHLDLCEFCREYVADYTALTAGIDDAVATRSTKPNSEYIDSVYAAVLRGSVISLQPASEPEPTSAALLAADGGDRLERRLENIGTLFSESPEVVLRIMRDHDHHLEYVQLVSDDPQLIDRVFVQIPELDLNVLTDRFGRSELSWGTVDDVSKYQWLVKLPDAICTLSPFEIDWQAAEYRESVTLRTSRDDQVRVEFESHPDSKLLTIRVLQLDGRSDFGTVQVAVAHGDQALSDRLSDKDRLQFDLDGPSDEIAVKLFLL